MPAVIDKGMNMFKKIMVPVDLAHRDAIAPALQTASDLATVRRQDRVKMAGQVGGHHDQIRARVLDRLHQYIIEIHYRVR